MKLVIVESPTKARTIRKFLGKQYQVESCMGHIRDLPQSAKDIPEKFKKDEAAKLGVDVERNFAPFYCIPKNKVKIVQELRAKLKNADELILATDEDREGESISWHLVETLKPKVPIKRMVFHEITKEAIQNALGEFRDIDENLVRAQEARRILDRLVGYTISPLIWKKVAYGLSAGRVQSVALRLIAEREAERLRFVRSEYWGLLAKCKKEQVDFEARLITYAGQRIAMGKDFASETGQLNKDRAAELLHLDEVQARALVSELRGQSWQVAEVEEKPFSRKPAPPFITSTLQQEANRKLGFSSRQTMQVAQKLYEQGYITYMRTDSTNLSQQAIEAARHCIESRYGAKFLPSSPRLYSGKKVKGAQEAHEAIRPAGTEFVVPEETGLVGEQLRLYELIWKRTVASQMVNAEQKQVQVKFSVGRAIFSASGMSIIFPGFLRAYVEGRDDADSALEEREVRLPDLRKGEMVTCADLQPTQHETKPPARFTEATLIKVLEQEGIGRPSTYASIISTIQDRGYVRKQNNALVPTFTALVVSNLLVNHLPEYVDLKFTSAMEGSLDEIAAGDLDWVKYLEQIYFGPQGLRAQVAEKEKTIAPEQTRSIRLHGLDDLDFRVGRYGAYVCKEINGEEICASLPDDQSPGDITAEAAEKLLDQKIHGADALGHDPASGLPVYILTGRYGPYVQLGDSEGEKNKPKRASIPAGFSPENLTFQEALDLLSLPKTLGQHPDTGKDIKVGLGRFGPYVVHDGDFRSIPKGESLFTMQLARTLEILAEPKRGRGGGAKKIKELGVHPGNKEVVEVLSGRYGPYIKWGKKNVSLPQGVEPNSLELEQAIKLIAEKFGEVSEKKSGGDPAKGGRKAGKVRKVAKKRRSASKTMAGALAKRGAAPVAKKKTKVSSAGQSKKKSDLAKRKKTKRKQQQS